MPLCQIVRAHSLREIEGGLAHLGIEVQGRSSLSYANGRRLWQWFENVCYRRFETVAAQA
jgi:hypothetical protein